MHCPFIIDRFSSYVILFSQQSHLFDNEGTVFFAMFMGIWGERTYIV